MSSDTTASASASATVAPPDARSTTRRPSRKVYPFGPSTMASSPTIPPAYVDHSVPSTLLPVGAGESALANATHGSTSHLPPHRESYQLKALFMKTAVYQRRQWFTNVCCVMACPILMIAISAILGAVISGLIQKTATYSEILYCSNSSAMDPYNLPLALTSSNLTVLPSIAGKGAIPAATVSTIAAANYFRYAGSTVITAPAGASSFNIKRPCVNWFGESYPFSAIYERDPGININIGGKDTMFFAQPVGGWIPLINSTLTNGTLAATLAAKLQYFAQYQHRPWYIYAASDSVTAGGLLGTAAPQSAVPLTQGNSVPAQAYKYANQSNGILDTMELRYLMNVTASQSGTFSSAGFSPVPVWIPISGTNATALDAVLGSSLSNVVSLLAAVDKTPLLSSSSNAQLTAFYAAVSALTQNMPYAGVFFETLDVPNRKFKHTLQVGTDTRLASASGFPDPGWRQVILQSRLGQAYLRFSSGINGALGSATITQGLRAFPQIDNTSLNFPFSGLIGRILYPFGVSFLLPIFVIILVKEKEDRILMMMRMNGLKSYTYYITHYIHFYILFIISTAFFLIVGRLSRLELFSRTGPGVLVFLFFTWGHVQVAMAFVFGALFSRSQIALVVVFLIVLCGVIISLVTDDIFTVAPTAYFLWPPFAFYRCLSILNIAAITSTVQPYTSIPAGSEIAKAVGFLWGEVIFFLLLAVYLQQVFPSEFGIQKPWHFPVTEPLEHFLFKRRRMQANNGIDPQSENALAISIQVDAKETEFEDDDVKQERTRVLDKNYQADCPLIMKGMRKVYKGRRGLGPKIAVKDVTLAVEKGMVFGLLGPNGAGKTTLISILTGLYESSAGVARLAGFDIQTQTAQVYQHMGICPQFDILFMDLTVRENLLFYARLKGISAAKEAATVLKSMEQVALDTKSGAYAKNLSGGEKRRLSIAIALVGDPTVIFLDEPTTGLDPEVRRMIWTIIEEAREGKTIILTTHSMEEVEVLSQRVGIMAKGTLRCIGSPLRLKQLYGSGFKLYFISQPKDVNRAATYIESILPTNFKRLDAFSNTVSYEFHPPPGALGALFQEVESNKARYGIEDYGISMTTLDEVFLRLISETDAGAD
ncbi:hypothetical protein SeMB42_g01671 [Synchytrium endobioticum]|uniref:ABC transporter domain-containing protein n=1 Tax=Synchytrium endobioticum TaxID=286115 RepID=A0A507D9N7_9FUNG|nr:hypothetical protein SeLEV6574_g02240 [Synchytrium endobioticum]TPX52060.1 hypothetical protein SeMB42_g01671 [Synchytrium endobioticum]